MATKRGEVDCLHPVEYEHPGVLVYARHPHAAEPTTILFPQFDGWRTGMAEINGYFLTVLLVRDGEQLPAAARAGTTAEG